MANPPFCKDQNPGSRQARHLLGLFLLALIGCCLLLFFLLLTAYRESAGQAEISARNTAGVLEARLEGGLRRVQADLENIATGMPLAALAEGGGAAYRELVGAMLARHAAHFPEIVGYRIIDAAGDVRFASETSLPSANAADRSYFIELRDHPERKMVFSEVVVGRLVARSMMIIAVPLRGAGGEFLGVAMAPLDLGYFQQLFDSVDLGPRGVITFRRSDDGRLVLRRPARPGSVNQTLSGNPMHLRIEAGDRQGTIRYHAALDNIERIYAYRRVGDYPFYVAVGIASVDYLAGWTRTAGVVVLVALLLMSGLGAVLVRLLRVERQEWEIAARLAESEARYRMLAENSHDVIWTLDIPTRRFTYVSPSVEQLRGYTPAEVLAESLEASLTPESAASVMSAIDERLRRIATGDKTARVVRSEMEQSCKDGSVVMTEVVSSYLLDADGQPKTILGITRNISERKAAENALRESNVRLQAKVEEIGHLQAALQEQAVHDGLTGLYNRRYLDETLERELSRARREAIPLALVMLDIDYFKRVNDTHGHQGGDEVLRVLAEVLTEDIRAEDIACRYGGEEFLILLPNMPLDAALVRAETWRAKIEALTVRHGEQVIRFTVSLGLAAFPEHGQSPDELTRSVDLALYQAKHAGRNRVSVFSPSDAT